MFEVSQIVENVLRPAQQRTDQTRPCNNCLTAEEWSKRWHVSRERARHFIRAMLALGRMRKGEKMVVAIDGRRLPVVCFELMMDTAQQADHAHGNQNP